MFLYYVNRDSRVIVEVDRPLGDSVWIPANDYHNRYVKESDLSIGELQRHYDPDSLDALALRIWLRVANSADPSYFNFVKAMREAIPSFRLRTARAMRGRLDKALHKAGKTLPHMKGAETRPNINHLIHILNEKG